MTRRASRGASVANRERRLVVHEPASIPARELEAIRRGKARRTHAIEAWIEFDLRRVSRLARRHRAGGQTAVDPQPRVATVIDVRDEEIAAREDGGVDAQIAASSHVRARDLDLAIRDQA